MKQTVVIMLLLVAFSLYANYYTSVLVASFRVNYWHKAWCICCTVVQNVLKLLTCQNSVSRKLCVYSIE